MCYRLCYRAGREPSLQPLLIRPFILSHAIEQHCRAHRDGLSWPTLNVELDDAAGRRLHLRLATKPSDEQKRIYRTLGLNEQPLEPKQYLAIRYTDRLSEAGFLPSVGSAAIPKTTQ